MKYTLPFMRAALAICATGFALYSCSKGSGSGNGDGNNTCTSNITASAAATSSDPCAHTGTITVTASGGTGTLSYKLDNGNFQSSNTFSNVAAGAHTVAVKDGGGVCIATATATVTALPLGAQFAAVKAVIQANCAISGCHVGGASAAGSADFSVDCNISDRASLIKTRAVDQANTANQMPQPPRAALSQADRDKITAWVSAGGRMSD